MEDSFFMDWGQEGEGRFQDESRVYFMSTDFPSDSDGKGSTCNAGDVGSISGPGRSPGERNGNPLQYSCLENPMDRGAWQATWGHNESDMTEELTLS